jgi:hypothetical protein
MSELSILIWVFLIISTSTKLKKIGKIVKNAKFVKPSSNLQKGSTTADAEEAVSVLNAQTRNVDFQSQTPKPIEYAISVTSRLITKNSRIRTSD